MGAHSLGEVLDLPHFPWFIHLLDRSTSVVLVQLGQEGLAVAEGGHPQPTPPMLHRNVGGKGLFQREGLWLWPSTTLSVITVLWNTAILRPLSAFISLPRLQQRALTPHGSKQGVSP